MKNLKVYGLKFIRKLLETKRKILWSVFLPLSYTCTHTLPGISLLPSFPHSPPLARRTLAESPGLSIGSSFRRSPLAMGWVRAFPMCPNVLCLCQVCFLCLLLFNKFSTTNVADCLLTVSVSQDLKPRSICCLAMSSSRES